MGVMAQSKKNRGEPYYRVQLRDPFTQAWRNYRTLSFETVERARAFAATLAGPVQTRVVRYDAHGASPVADDEQE
jgi:hypothetical protein